MMNCDPEGPLMVYVSKMVETSQKGIFYAFGRVFSGTIKAGQMIRIMGHNNTPCKNNELFVITLQLALLMIGSKVELVCEVPCVNTVCLCGIEKYLVKSV